MEFVIIISSISLDDLTWLVSVILFVNASQFSKTQNPKPQNSEYSDFGKSLSRGFGAFEILGIRDIQGIRVLGFRGFEESFKKL